MDELFRVEDFEFDGNMEKLVFPENIPVKMKIIGFKEGILKSNDFPYYVLECNVLNGDHAGQAYDLFINTKYSTKEGKLKIPYGFKKVLQGLCKDFSIAETKAGRGNDLPETFKTQLSPQIGKEVEIAFFKQDGDYQNLIYIKTLSEVEEKGTETSKGNDF